MKTARTTKGNRILYFLVSKDCNIVLFSCAGSNIETGSSKNTLNTRMNKMGRLEK